MQSYAYYRIASQRISCHVIACIASHRIRIASTSASHPHPHRIHIRIASVSYRILCARIVRASDRIPSHRLASHDIPSPHLTHAYLCYIAPVSMPRWPPLYHTVDTTIATVRVVVCVSVRRRSRSWRCYMRNRTITHMQALQDGTYTCRMHMHCTKRMRMH